MTLILDDCNLSEEGRKSAEIVLYHSPHRFREVEWADIAPMREAVDSMARDYDAAVLLDRSSVDLYNHSSRPVFAFGFLQEGLLSGEETKFELEDEMRNYLERERKKTSLFREFERFVSSGYESFLVVKGIFYPILPEMGFASVVQHLENEGKNYKAVVGAAYSLPTLNVSVEFVGESEKSELELPNPLVNLMGGGLIHSLLCPTDETGIYPFSDLFVDRPVPDIEWEVGRARERYRLQGVEDPRGLAELYRKATTLSRENDIHKTAFIEAHSFT